LRKRAGRGVLVALGIGGLQVAVVEGGVVHLRKISAAATND
jgi:hypothetical protein